MSEFSEGDLDLGEDAREPSVPSCRDLIRAATNAPHERLHRHAGFSVLKNGTITRRDYRALLIRLYGFYLPFESATTQEPLRTKWLENDLAWLGVGASAIACLNLCKAIPHYDCPQRRLGALYVVEGSGLGGRLLCRGLDHLLGPTASEGRRFFAGRGALTGAAWLNFLDRLGSVGTDPIGRAALVSAAVETFEVFETWLDGWNEIN